MLEELKQTYHRLIKEYQLFMYNSLTVDDRGAARFWFYQIKQLRIKLAM